MLRIIGNRICVCHGHDYDPKIPGDKPIGTPIQCFSMKKLGIKLALKKAQDLHRQIELSKKKSH